MRWAILLVALAIPSAARADAYAWGGAIDGLEVSVLLSGFRDGAGGSGWTEDGARRFARRAAEIAALTGDALLTETLENDDGLVLVLGARRVLLGIRDFEGSDAEWDDVRRAVRALGLSARRARPSRLYTIEILGPVPVTLEEPSGQAFFEACVPCSASDPIHVSGSRRVIGVFSRRAAALRALRPWRAQGVRGRVVPL